VRRPATGKYQEPLNANRKSNRNPALRSRVTHSVVRKYRKRGQILVMLAILIPVLLGVVAMGVDITVFYWTWSRMQSAADASVLAGSASLPGSPSLAIAAATAYAKANGMVASEITTPVVAANDLSISITLTRPVPYYFGRVLGLV